MWCVLARPPARPSDYPFPRPLLRFLSERLGLDIASGKCLGSRRAEEVSVADDFRSILDTGSWMSSARLRGRGEVVALPSTAFL